MCYWLSRRRDAPSQRSDAAEATVPAAIPLCAVSTPAAAAFGEQRVHWDIGDASAAARTLLAMLQALAEAVEGDAASTVAISPAAVEALGRLAGMGASSA